MLRNRHYFNVFVLSLAVLFFSVGCAIDTALVGDRLSIDEPAAGGEAVAAVEVQIVLPTAVEPANTLTPTVERSTLTPIPTATLAPSSTPTVPPTYTPVPTDTPVPIDRRCPAQDPIKPNYSRLVLGDEPWPTPFPDPQPHFWFDKPLPGGGRYLINTTFPYGYDANGAYLLHNGVDSGAVLGTPLLAIGDGTIIVAQPDRDAYYGWRCNWYGQLVVIELDQQWLGQPIYALYGHVLNIEVEVGDRVLQGDQVAEVGFGGAAIVPHLHFELRVGSNEFSSTRNPMLWIKPPESRGVIAGRLIDPTGRPWQGVWLRADSLDDATTEYISWTYLDDPQHLINPDFGYAENFVIADVRPGRYRIYVEVNDVIYTGDVEVEGGDISTVEIVTE